MTATTNLVTLRRCHDNVYNLLDARGVDMDKAEVEVNGKGTVDDTVDKPKVDDEVVGAEAT